MSELPEYRAFVLPQEPKKIERGSYVLLIAGAIGSGKSTLFKMIIENYKDHKITPIYEYIDDPEYKEGAQIHLQDYLKGVENDLTFQNYIQCYYLAKMAPQNVQNKEIIILERGVDDSLAIFCNLANKKRKLDVLNFAMLYTNCLRMNETVTFPSYFFKNFEMSKIRTNKKIIELYEEVAKIINDDLEKGVKNRVIALYNSPAECYDRMYTRARNGETSVYTKEYIELNCRMYENIYRMIEDPTREQINFVDLGKLFDPVDWSQICPDVKSNGY